MMAKSRTNSGMATLKKQNKKMNLYLGYKRIFDLFIISIIIIYVIPICLIIGIILLACYGKPIVFKQKRAGYLGKPFFIYKFRTMTDYIDENGNLLPDSARLTTFGKLLRMTSMDELPEIWNVIKGDMSLVGPRPLPLHYLDYLYDEEKQRFYLRPGITGLAQVRGRNYSSWDERFKYDLYYISHASLIEDISIIARTIINVICFKDVIADPRSYMMNLDEERKGIYE